MNRFVTPLSCLFLALLAACATSNGTAPDRTAIAKLKDSGTIEVRAITYTPAPFVLASAGKIATGSLFGIIGGAVAANSMQKAGQEMITTLGVDDPAAGIRDQLAHALETDFGLHATPDTAPPPQSDVVTDLQARFGKDVVLDTRTLGWELIYYPSDWSHHYLIYAGRGRLLRLSDGKVLWEGRCLQKLPDEKGSRHTVDEYKANNGELLKQRVQQATKGCADHLLGQLAGKPVAVAGAQ